MLSETDLRFVQRQRVAHLATADANGRPHVVPVCFAYLEGRFCIAIDEKPKRTRRLKRLRNIAENPSVALVFDRYDDDWSRLGWVMVQGTASVIASGPEHDRAVAAFCVRDAVPLDGAGGKARDQGGGREGSDLGGVFRLNGAPFTPLIPSIPQGERERRVRMKSQAPRLRGRERAFPGGSRCVCGCYRRRACWRSGRSGKGRNTRRAGPGIRSRRCRRASRGRRRGRDRWRGRGW